jgi:4-hydroxybenzoate polyprenyltransferase/phosphoserine phosphatase
MPLLAIDLDGTLSKTDTLLEQACRLFADRPWMLFPVVLGKPRSRAALKRRLGEAATLDPSSLVFDPDVLRLAREAREAGQTVVLATATDARLAQAVADHLGVFDAVFASDGTCNLKGPAKGALLEARFGRGGFDYVGDSEADRPVWRAARRAYVAGGDGALAARVASDCTKVVLLGEARERFRPGSVLATLRPHQWAKNVLVFAPMLAAHRLGMPTVAAAAAAFVAFSLCASSVYVLNDLADLPYDRAHPTKRQRPFASGDLPLAWGPALMTALLGSALLIACFLPTSFLAMLLAYVVATSAYTLALKRRPVWDVMTLAGLYTLRIFAGGAATHVPVSLWLLAFSMFLFFCLAVVKRQTELVRLARAGGTAAPGRGYEAGDLAMLRSMAASSGMIAVLVLALYVNSVDVLTLYRHPRALWALCPILLFWVSRVLMVSNRGLMDEDPVVFAMRDRVSLACGAASVAVVLAGAV